MVEELRSEVRDYLVKASEKPSGDPYPFTHDGIAEALLVTKEERPRLRKAVDELMHQGIIEQREHFAQVFVLKGPAGGPVRHALIKRLGSNYSTGYLLGFLIIAITFVVYAQIGPANVIQDPQLAYNSGLVGGFVMGGIATLILGQTFAYILTDVVRQRVNDLSAYRNFTARLAWSGSAAALVTVLYVGLNSFAGRSMNPGELIALIIGAIGLVLAVLPLKRN